MEDACAGKAYSLSISKDCALCFARAAREVFNSKNASTGYFCSACAARAVARLNAAALGRPLVDARVLSGHAGVEIPATTSSCTTAITDSAAAGEEAPR